MSPSEIPDDPQAAWQEQDQGQWAEHRARQEQERGTPELPPNVPPGFLGEKGFNLRKSDDDGPHGLNAGIIQESTSETRLLVVLLLYFIFFPAAFFLLWRMKSFSLKGKIVLTVVGVIGIAFFAWRLWSPLPTTG
ncbi:MAG TPA: hypothetical protein VFG89_08735 [Coriobacteriia bacterium]|nr:hypothetical protein [Coriobacteriia bacterium]